jgi:hypothetical protein
MHTDFTNNITPHALNNPYLVDEILEAALVVEREHQDHVRLTRHITKVQVQNGVDVGVLKSQEQF